MGTRTLVALVLLACLSPLRPVGADAPAVPSTSPAVTTEGTFERFSGRVVKVQVLEKSSVAKSVIGSGFFVSGSGLVLTNYHVISEQVGEPNDFRVECVTSTAQVLPARVVAIDVVHDLALLATDTGGREHFELAAVEVEQGLRLYSLGHPYDIGLTIVEGTYNGLLHHSIYPRIHFTGAINSGMSGGPTITAEGRVVGINVASMGDEVGFLVPVDRALGLLASADTKFVPTDFSATIVEQVLRHQDKYVDTLLAKSTPGIVLGGYDLPGTLAPYFKCWGNYEANAHELYAMKSHQCSTDDYIYINDDLVSGEISYSHHLFQSRGLNPFRFYSLFTHNFGLTFGVPEGAREDLTEFQCTHANVQQGDRVLHAALCVRGYRRLKGLYDAVFKVAALGEAHQGVESMLMVTGVSFENALLLSQRYLEAIAWRP